MDLADLCWIATASYGLHIVEELVLDWRSWARSVMGITVEWGVFYATNALVIVLGVVCAELAPHHAALALTFPALMLINAVVFHIGGFVWKRGRFSPGLLTAVLLFLPVGAACYRCAWTAGSVSLVGVAGSLLLGALLMASPIVLLKLRTRPYFQQKS